MIQQLFNTMIFAVVAKFLLNDIPHATGIFEETPVKYRLACPRCRYRYSVSFSNGPYAWEACPVCGYGASFSEFVGAGEVAWRT